MKYMIVNSGISLFEKGNTLLIAKDNLHYEDVLKDLSSANPKLSFEDVKNLIDVKKKIESFSKNGVSFSLEDNELHVSIDGTEIQNLSTPLRSRLISMIKSEGLERDLALTAMTNFIVKLYKNPSFNSVNQLYGFLTANNLPLTNEGTFYAYKKVGADYKDLHSHTFDNSIGKEVFMPRYEVEDNPHITCSKGLHCCSYDYLDNYGSSHIDGPCRVVIVEVDPADVVSVPVDYDNAKMRVCKYTVVDELSQFFETQLEKYVVGKHENNWMHETYDKLFDVYTSIFGKNFSWGSLGVEVTRAMTNDFLKAMEDKFADFDVTDFKEWLDGDSIPTPADAFHYLSLVDKNYIVDND